jgi:hypothetical protein
MVKYWTSKKSRSVVEERRAELDLLIAFANADITTEGQPASSNSCLDHYIDIQRYTLTIAKWKVDVQLDHLIGALQRRLRYASATSSRIN